MLITTTRKLIHGVCAYAVIAALSVSAQAATIIKLNLGGVGPDVGMGAPAGQPAGVLSTVDETTGPPPSGDQLTNIEYTGALNFIPDINTTTASFSLNGLNLVGSASVSGSLVVQNFTGGVFSLYDTADSLLLQGPVGSSALTGILGSPGTGALFSTLLTTVTGGSLAPYIDPGSVALSMNLSNVNGGSGFTVSGGGPLLNAFLADGSLTISADIVPEPATITVLCLGLAIGCGVRRRK